MDVIFARTVANVRQNCVDWDCGALMEMVVEWLFPSSAVIAPVCLLLLAQRSRTFLLTTKRTMLANDAADHVANSCSIHSRDLLGKRTA